MSQLEIKNQPVSTTNRWKNFWEKQTTPGHHYNDEKWYRLYGQEINLILETLQYQGGSVLETGCGNGALFDYLNINKEDYIGTDISEAMLNIFKAKHPHVNLVCVDSSSYIVDRKFSLIYSNGVVQYFKPKQLDVYVKNSLAMLEPNGIIILGNVLWDKCRAQFYSRCYLKGKLSLNFSRGSLPSYLKNLIKQAVGRDDLGYWNSPRDFLKYQKENVQLYVFGSLFHAYRFSVALKKVS